jgi:hypothetical protein
VKTYKSNVPCVTSAKDERHNISLLAILPEKESELEPWEEHTHIFSEDVLYFKVRMLVHC